MTAEAGSKRARVRRLLLDPLEGMGFRFKKGTDPNHATATLNGICDDLGHMSDDNLRALKECMRSKGEGSQKCFWPPRATFVAYAEALQPRPLEDLPAMASWFGSVEGPRAVQDGTVVSTFLFIQDRKRPPLSDQDRRFVLLRGKELSSEAALRRDRRSRGMMRAEDPQWLRWYEGLEARAMALIDQGKAKRGAAA